MSPPSSNSSSSASLKQKRGDLHTLISHIKTIHLNDQNGPIIKCIISRLTAEIRKAEVQEMYNHIMQCPGLSNESPVLLEETVIPALNEVADLIRRKEKDTQLDLLLSQEELEFLDNPLGVGVSASAETEDESGDSNLIPVMNGCEMNSKGSHANNAEPCYSYDNGNADDPRQEHSKLLSSPAQSQSMTKKKKQAKKSSWLNAFLRSVILDLPFAVSVFILVACITVKNMYFTFLIPVMESTLWTRERMETEYTGYRRECDASDISSTNVDDFIIDPLTMTAKDALDITNKHGMSIFPKILTPETAANMRKWVLERNENLSEDDEIPLISQNQRWSFPIGADEDPSVPPVLKEIATHVMLQDTMDLIFDEDPALVEFTAITSAYGAGDQHWHADNSYDSSQMHYARSFVPMYSLFIPLQDTTAEMGATSACPGTHLCGSEDRLSKLCDNLDFRVHDTRGRLAETEADHVWKSGDGFLFHLNTYHRGPGHTDPNGTERVMLIMTVSNRPKGPYFDRRQISLGTSYSNKWDMWGLTMKDLAVIDQIKGFPWKYLRTFGVWKPKANHRNHDVKWGWDYVTVACSRIVNDQMGFRQEDIDFFRKKMSKFGPVLHYLFGYVPPEGDYDEESMTIDNGWRAFIAETFNRFTYVSSIFYGVSCFFYVITGLITTGPRSTIKRLFLVNTAVGLAFYGWFRYVSNTPWGKDILSKHALESPYVDNIETSEWTVVPSKNDILFSERLYSPFLAGMNIILEQQPGNAKFYDLLSKNAHLFSKDHHVTSGHRRKVLEDISKAISDSGSRVLKNNVNGDWYVPSEKETELLIRRSLVSESSEIMKLLNQEMLFLKSECLYNNLRKTAMMKVHAMANLENLFKSIYDLNLDETSLAGTSSPKRHSRLFIPKLNYRSSATDTVDVTPNRSYIPAVNDHVECIFKGEGWFQGRVQSVNKRRGTAAIQFYDGDYDPKVMLRQIRLFQPFQIGESVLVENSPCYFVGVNAFGSATCSDDEGLVIADVYEMARMDMMDIP